MEDKIITTAFYNLVIMLLYYVFLIKVTEIGCILNITDIMQIFFALKLVLQRY